MESQKLAIKGGDKVIKKSFLPYNSIGNEELEAASSVIKSGVLSKFLGTWSEDFYGGPKVLELEKLASKMFKVKHAVAVNSWTSGLIAAVGSLDIEPGDEIIVSTWTMCASATAILHWNAIPVFADIDPKTFNIDLKSIEKNISNKTKAIMAIDIFGQSCDMKGINLLAKKYNLKVITDTAQAPGSYTDGKLTGTLADVGGFSLNYHKHIHCGEGGILVTNDDEIYERLTLIRNHGEAVVEDKKVSKINNIIGYNFRLGEIEAAIAIEQLKKLEDIVANTQSLVKRFNDGIKDLNGLITPYITVNNTHAYYVYPLLLDPTIIKTERKKIIDALNAEGLDFWEGFITVHMYPMYQKKIAYGSKGFPWKSEFSRNNISYKKGICPVAEKYQDELFFGYGFCTHELSFEDIDLMIMAFRKVWKNLNEL